MNNVEVITGYVPGIIGRVTELHAQYYSKHWNFDHFFEAKVASEISLFMSNYNEAKDCIWSLSSKGNIEGSITIDSSSEVEGIAHLRWFIVSDHLKGSGVGNYLMKQAMSFCAQKEFKNVYLWTFQGLDLARHLYEKHGFELVKELEGNQWGPTVIEQQFDVTI